MAISYIFVKITQRYNYTDDVTYATATMTNLHSLIFSFKNLTITIIALKLLVSIGLKFSLHLTNEKAR